MGKKWDDATPGMKMLALFSLLLFSDGKKFSLTQLTEKLNCSKRIVLRIIDQMSGASYCDIVKTKEGNKVFFHMERPKSLPLPSLSPSNLDTLVMCRDFIWHLFPSAKNIKLDTIFNQLALAMEKSGNTEVQIHSDSIVRRVFRGRVDLSDKDTIFKEIEKAIRDKKFLKVVYKKNLTNPPKELKYAPVSFVLLHDVIYVEGYVIRDDLPYNSTLALHRISKTSLTDESFGKMNLHAVQTENLDFGLINDEPFDLKVSIGPSAALYVVERKWSDEQNILMNEDGSILLTFKVKNTWEAKTWVLGFGAQAVVVEPHWFKEELKTEIEAMKDNYQNEK